MKVIVTCECTYDEDKKPIGLKLPMNLEDEDIIPAFSSLGNALGIALKEALEKKK